MNEYAISHKSVQQAVERLKGQVHRTPVLTCQTLDDIASSHAHPTEYQDAESPRIRLFFKARHQPDREDPDYGGYACENFQKVGAFKYRGALNAVKSYQESHPGVKTTFVTHSSGNHAQGVALAAKNANAKAVVVMSAVRGYGAEVILCEATMEARDAACERYMEASADVCHFIHAANNVDVMSGQATAVVELLEQVEQEHGVALDAIVVPISGGGLCSGAAVAAKSHSETIKVFGAEPVAAADGYLSLQAGEITRSTAPRNTVADGLSSSPGPLTWPVIRDLVPEIALVSEDEIISATRLMWERMKIIVEPSSAVAVAVLLLGKLRDGELGGRIQNVGVVLTGGNVDLDRLPWLS
ncbi:hypothetical protein PybrP1_007631 [[Pythium] brassicae (nom. inval.)]|nr:hypothetical protein PybrP1_007631 [[Pythium] brassicae (nom. inval.)]